MDAFVYLSQTLFWTKNISQIEYLRHRSPVNFGINLLCGLIAYCYQPKKPSLNLEQDWAQYA